MHSRNDTQATPPDASPADLRALVDSGTVLLATRKRDGSWVRSPVSLVGDGDHGYFRTWHTAGKVKRLRNFPEVRVAPCRLTGKPTGPEVAARAHRVHGAEEQKARRLLAGRFPVLQRTLVPAYHRLRGWRTLHYALTLPDGRHRDPSAD